MTKVRDPSNRGTHRPIERPRRQIWSHPDGDETRPSLRARTRPTRPEPDGPTAPPLIAADYRYMGTSDLLAELSKDSFRATPDVERKVTEVVLKQLDDRSADVSSLAVKCIPPLVKGASEKTTETVIDALCAKLAMTAKSDAQRRDAGVIGLKSLVAELGDSHPASGAVVASLARKLVAFFAGQITDEPDAAVVGDVLDILRAAATSHGRAMAPHHAETRDALLAYLRSDGRVAKKRAAQCLAALAASFTDAAAASTVDDVLGELHAACATSGSRGGAGDERALWAWLLGALARCANAGFQFSKKIAGATPAVAELCERCVGEEEEPTREACLQALEAFSARCPGSARFTSRGCRPSRRT